MVPFPQLTRRLTGLALVAAAGLALAPSAAAGDDDDITIQFLASTGLDGNGTAKARYRVKDDSTDFQVELEKLAQGSYELLVAGVQQGQISVGAGGEGEIEFETPQDGPKPLLDFEVLGQTIEVRQGDALFFSDVFSGGGSGGGGGGGGGGSAKTKLEVFLVNVGSDGNAKGRLRYEDKPGKTRFKVDLENLDPGLHELRVDGVVRASFDPAGVYEVELDFRDPPDDDPDDGDDDELELHFLLDFDPLGVPVEVVRDGEVLLTGVLPVSGSQSGVKDCSKGQQAAKDLGKAKADALRFSLHSTGVLFGACAQAVLAQDGDRLDLTVTLDGVGPGSYDVALGGVSQGTLEVLGGSGSLALSTEPSGDQGLLTGPVKGAELTVLLDGDTLLQAVVPVSVQAALDQHVKELHKDTKVKVNLYNAGEDLDTRGVALLKVTPKKVLLKLKARDLPPGEYTLRADGLDQGPLTVDAKGRARLLLDSQATPGQGKKQPLEFEAAGALLELVDGDGDVVLTTVLE